MRIGRGGGESSQPPPPAIKIDQGGEPFIDATDRLARPDTAPAGQAEAAKKGGFLDTVRNLTGRNKAKELKAAADASKDPEAVLRQEAQSDNEPVIGGPDNRVTTEPSRPPDWSLVTEDRVKALKDQIANGADRDTVLAGAPDYVRSTVLGNDYDDLPPRPMWRRRQPDVPLDTEDAHTDLSPGASTWAPRIEAGSRGDLSWDSFREAVAADDVDRAALGEPVSPFATDAPRPLRRRLMPDVVPEPVVPLVTSKPSVEAVAPADVAVGDTADKAPPGYSVNAPSRAFVRPEPVSVTPISEVVTTPAPEAHIVDPSLTAEAAALADVAVGDTTDKAPPGYSVNAPSRAFVRPGVAETPSVAPTTAAESIDTSTPLTTRRTFTPAGEIRRAGVPTGRARRFTPPAEAPSAASVDIHAVSPGVTVGPDGTITGRGFDGTESVISSPATAPEVVSPEIDAPPAAETITFDGTTRSVPEAASAPEPTAETLSTDEIDRFNTLESRLAAGEDLEDAEAVDHARILAKARRIEAKSRSEAPERSTESMDEFMNRVRESGDVDRDTLDDWKTMDRDSFDESITDMNDDIEDIKNYINGPRRTLAEKQEGRARIRSLQKKQKAAQKIFEKRFGEHHNSDTEAGSARPRATLEDARRQADTRAAEMASILTISGDSGALKQKGVELDARIASYEDALRGVNRDSAEGRALQGDIDHLKRLKAEARRLETAAKEKAQQKKGKKKEADKKAEAKKAADELEEQNLKVWSSREIQSEIDRMQGSVSPDGTIVTRGELQRLQEAERTATGDEKVKVQKEISELMKRIQKYKDAKATKDKKSDEGPMKRENVRTVTNEAFLAMTTEEQAKLLLEIGATMDPRMDQNLVNRLNRGDVLSIDERAKVAKVFAEQFIDHGKKGRIFGRNGVDMKEFNRIRARNPEIAQAVLNRVLEDDAIKSAFEGRFGGPGKAEQALKFAKKHPGWLIVILALIGTLVAVGPATAMVGAAKVAAAGAAR